MVDAPTLAQRFSDHFKRGRQAPYQLCEYWVGVDGETGELGAEWADKPHRLVFDLLHHAVFQENEIENLRRQIAELRAELDANRKGRKHYKSLLEAAEAEIARLKALPLKDEAERVLEEGRKNTVAVMKALMATGSRDNLLLADAVHRADDAARALLSRLRAGEQEGWRTMDSAPRDGTNILYRNKFREIGFCHWDVGYDEGDQPCWWDNEADQEVCPVIWLPADILPAFPAPSEQGGDRG